MIVCKKPWTLYDVDLVGAAAAVVIVIAAGWFVVRPWQQTWSAYRVLADARAETKRQLRDDIIELERFEQSLVPLEDVVVSWTNEVPHTSAFPRLLRKITDLAMLSDLVVLNVAPRPAQANGAYLVSDVDISGRGRSRDFIRFLDQLAQENPYQCLQTCSIGRPANATEPICDLAWTLRLYLLPETEAGGDKEQS